MDKIVSLERNPAGHTDIYLLNQAEPVRLNIPYFLLADKALPGWRELKGNLPLKYYQEFNSGKKLWDVKKIAPPDTNWLHIYDERDSALIVSGLNFFKNIDDFRELKILAFDIESKGLTMDGSAKTLLISNTFRAPGRLERKLFAYDEYKTDTEFLQAWAQWVQEVNPDIITGHNIYSFDLPYLAHCARRNGIELKLGRDNSALRFNTWESKFRRDQSQFYSYNEARIYGRNIIDTFFLSIKADTGRKYESYGLKQIIKQEGLEQKDRVFYDSAKIKDNYQNPTEWEKIKSYAIHDADDALSLFDLHIPAYYNMAKIVPKAFSNLINTASGSQINQMLIQKYIQSRHSIPLASPTEDFEGALSGSHAGLYKHCFKVDVASLYPSIMLANKISDPEKDPLGVTLSTLDNLRTERLRNKHKARLYNNPHLLALSESQKVLINSYYGAMGTPGLNFNAPHCAAEVTRLGREILSNAMKTAAEFNLTIANFDTDSITVTDGTEWNDDRKEAFINLMNSRSPDGIKWENDGYFKSAVILKTKNYALMTPDNKVKMKGDVIKATRKAPALREFLYKSVLSLLNDRPSEIADHYDKLVIEILSPNLDIRRWAFKRTLTETMSKSSRKNETKVMDALRGQERIQQGDKYYFYYKNDDTLALVDNYQNDHNIDRLLGALHDTVQAFEPVFPTELFLDLTLKRNANILDWYKKEAQNGL